MAKDILVIDIETKNTFFDVGGQGNIDKLEMSVTVVYSYNEDKYLSFWEKDVEELGRRMKDAGMIVGFAINRFDLPVLEKYFDYSTKALKRLDLLEEIELSVGRRIGLDLLAHANIGTGKTHNGLDAVKFWNEGNLKELEDYCRNDVKVTKEVYDLAKLQGFLVMPEKLSENMIRVDLDIERKVREMMNENTLF